MTLYVASDTPIEERTYETLFIEATYGTLRSLFSKEHVVRLATDEGCACKLPLGALRGFLQAQLQKVPELELYYCWMGDEGDPPEERLALAPEELVDEVLDLYVLYRIRQKVVQDGGTGERQGP
jgi:hypothetical protein